MGVLLQNVRQGLNLLFTPVLYYGVMASVALQLATWEKGDRTQDKFQDQYQNQGDKFDFIIVGGGTAGSVLANRLSQHYNTLLLEAGGEPSPLQFVPGFARAIVNHPQVDWSYMTVAQKKACAFSPLRRATWSSGKTLGGSGSLDFLTYLRGNPEDFDNWGRITGDASWNYDNLLKHFQKAEDLVANSTDPGAHRHGGSLRIQKSDYLPLGKQFLSAAEELGYKNVDLNGHFTEGFDYVYSTIKKGERQAPVRAFLDPVRKRKSLTIRKFAVVSKIKFREDTTAYGVEYERHGEKFLVYANREVILSAGAVGSPKILMLSGIGPKRHLEEFGVKALVNLPVGQNLQDHVGTYLGPFFINEPLTFAKDRDIRAESYVEYGGQGTGPLSYTGYSATGLISSLYAKGRGEASWPDLQLSLFPTTVEKSFATDLAHTHALNAEVLKKYYAHALGKHSFHVWLNVARPAGRGEIKLASRNPANPLVINPKYLEDPWDLDVKAGVDGLKKALRLVEGSTAFQNIGGRFTSEILPGCESTKFRSDEYFECYLRHFTVSAYNPVGTCAMGPKNSLFAVVDSKLRVLGVTGLRVVDASIMPAIVSGGTTGATIAIAEKAADMILSHWSNHVPQELDDLLNAGVSTLAQGHGQSHISNSIADSGTAHSETIVAKLEKPVNLFLNGNNDVLATKVTTLATTASGNMMKHMSPFSVTIKTSSPTPIPKLNIPTTTTPKPFSFLSFMSSTLATTTTTTIPTTTTTPPPPKTTSKPVMLFNLEVNSPTHMSFPIVSSTTRKPTTHYQKKKPLRKLIRPTTSSPKEVSVSESLLKTYVPATSPPETSTISSYYPAQLISSDFPVRQIYPDVPTTYRPEIVMIDPDNESILESLDPVKQSPLPPKVMTQFKIEPAIEEASTTKPIMYQIVGNVAASQNIPSYQYHPIVANSPPRFHRQQFYTAKNPSPTFFRMSPPPLSPQGVATSSTTTSSPVPFQFNFPQEVLDNVEFDRFTRHQNGNRYLEKPIKTHTHQHPGKVVRRVPKPSLSQSQSQIQAKIMAGLRRFIPGRGQGQGQGQTMVQPANVVYQGEDSVGSGSDHNYESFGRIIFNKLRERKHNQWRRYHQISQPHQMISTTYHTIPQSSYINAN